jgi:hypothetical protein
MPENAEFCQSEFFLVRGQARCSIRSSSPLARRSLRHAALFKTRIDINPSFTFSSSSPAAG